MYAVVDVDAIEVVELATFQPSVFQTCKVNNVKIIMKIDEDVIAQDWNRTSHHPPITAYLIRC